jgi:hypothetical protein
MPNGPEHSLSTKLVESVLRINKESDRCGVFLVLFQLPIGHEVLGIRWRRHRHWRLRLSQRPCMFCIRGGGGVNGAFYAGR